MDPNKNEEISLGNMLDPNPAPITPAPVVEDVVPPVAPVAQDPNKPVTPPVNEGKDKPEGGTTLDNDDNKQNVRNLFSSFTSVDNLSVENKEVLDTLLAKYNGTSFNENGDLLDKEGNVLKDFDALFTDVISEPSVKLDEQGNQIDDEGKIVRTKAELVLDDKDNKVNQLHALSGYEFADENGNTKVYPETEQGMEELSNDIAEISAANFREALFNRYPDLLAVARHLELGNTIDTFIPNADYKSLDAKTLSKEDKLNYIKKSFEIKNFEPNRIQKFMTLIQDSNTIDAEFEDAKASLQNYEIQVAQHEEQLLAQREQQRQQDTEKHWNTVKNIIDTDKIKHINIKDPKDKVAFYDYVSTAVDNQGNSQAHLDAASQPLEEKLAIDYLRFKKFDFGSIIKQEVQKQRTTNLKDLIARSAQLKETAIDDRHGKGGNELDISLSSLL